MPRYCTISLTLTTDNADKDTSMTVVTKQDQDRQPNKSVARIAMDSQGDSTLLKPRLGRRLVLFPVPLQGHINPMLQLASILHSNGFSITILHTHFNSPNLFNYPHFTFQQFPEASIESEAGWEGFNDVVDSLNHFNQYFATSKSRYNNLNRAKEPEKQNN